MTLHTALLIWASSAIRIRFVCQCLLHSGSFLPGDAPLSSTPKFLWLNPRPAYSSQVELPSAVAEACIVGVRNHRGKMDGETAFVETLGDFGCLFRLATHSCYLSRPSLSPVTLLAPYKIAFLQKSQILLSGNPLVLL